jgi:tetratricopeptide (TPR) repeat protein
MVRAHNDQMPLTIICGERFNEWSVHCESLEPYLTHTYELKYLNGQEIDELIALLTRHRSLGHLEHKSPEDRHTALSEKAGRHLLVALHEATLGKPFSDIIFDEYESIPDPRAQILYRTVCVLHRLGAPPRAGLISRVHGIALDLFKEKLFRPLEDVVFAKKPEGAFDYVYTCRHQHIAEMLFERVLVESKDRFDEYVRIISSLDVDYAGDRAALRGLANAKELERLFPDIDMARAIFAAARLRDSKNPGIPHQEALLEMHVGSIDKAYDLLQAATALRPENLAVAHTLAELSLKRSGRARNEAEKLKFRGEARKAALEVMRRGTRDSHAQTTLLKIGLEEVEEGIERPQDTHFANLVRDFEKLLAGAKQCHPNDSYILDIEAKFAVLFQRNPDALAALRRAFSTNKHSTYIASRLAGLLENNGDRQSALSVLKEALDANPTDKDLHYRMGLLIEKTDPARTDDIIYHLRHAFVPNDTRCEAQFWYARAEFLYGDRVNAESIFRELADSNVDHREKVHRRSEPTDRIYYGTVDRMDTTYCFILRDGDGARVFARPADCIPGEWGRFRRGARVRFCLAFNYYGAIAISLALSD